MIASGKVELYVMKIVFGALCIVSALVRAVRQLRCQLMAMTGAQSDI